jgi:hypothetical protein
VNPYRIAGVPPADAPPQPPLRKNGPLAVLFCKRKNGGGWVATVTDMRGEREVVSREGVRWFYSGDGVAIEGPLRDLLDDEAAFQEALRSVGRGRQR